MNEPTYLIYRHSLRSRWGAYHIQESGKRDTICHVDTGRYTSSMFAKGIAIVMARFTDERSYRSKDICQRCKQAGEKLLSPLDRLAQI